MNNSGYSVFEKNEKINTKIIYENIGVADAPLASTVEDLALFLETLITGSKIITEDIQDILFGKDSLNYMASEWYGLYGVYYGKGMFTEKFKHVQLFHHAGGELGYSITNIYIPEIETSITAFLNCGESYGCHEREEDMILKILNKVIK